MQWRMIIASVVLAAVGAAVASSVANAQACQELWVERNAYYNANGYCFKTVRATTYFGRKGCMVESEDNLKLSESVNTRIKSIKEREVGCNTTTSRGPTLADATCNQLWVERNAYYKAGGYCFQTGRSISYFGNDGCRKDLDEDVIEGKFSDVLRGRITEIMNLERRYSCN
jgi:hypothetical protein